MTEDHDIYHKALARLNAYIEQNGLKHSPEREVILKHICKQQKVFAISDVVKWVEKESMVRATVYNSIKILEKAEIIHGCVSVSGHKMQYELFCNPSNHIHIICTRCGRKAALDDAMFNTMITNKKYNNFNLRNYTLFVYGECKRCRRKSTPTQQVKP